MKNEKDEIVGTQQGVFDVLYECDFKSKDGHKLFHIKCSKCGWETNRQKRHILNKQNVICDHLDRFGKHIKYDMIWSNQRLHNIYKGMLNRCYNTKNKSYRFYGQKGVKICQEWLDNPLSFETWALQNGYSDSLTIDRIDSSKDYSPNNCQWITLQDNAKYKSTTNILTVDGQSHTGIEWSTLLELGINTINTMLRENDEEKVIRFVRCRLKDKSVKRHSKQTWFDAYRIY